MLLMLRGARVWFARAFGIAVSARFDFAERLDKLFGFLGLMADTGAD